uniref:hypothetical protein n=1 Tax=Flavobacterium sp. TaxID=239 RepID=UPI00404B0302
MNEFNELDAYELINIHFINQIQEYNSDSVIYWNTRQLKSPNFASTHYNPEDKFFYDEPPPPSPNFAPEYWDVNKIIGVQAMEWKEYDSFFKKNDTIDLNALWESKYNGYEVHNVSFPIYNPESKIAVIQDYAYRPFLNCGVGLGSINYYYKRTDNGWIKLNERYF